MSINPIIILVINLNMIESNDIMIKKVEREYGKKFREKLPADWVDQLEQRVLQIKKEQVS